MPWTLVQQSVAQTNNTSPAANALPAGSTQGNLLIAVCGAGNATTIVPPTNWSTIATLKGANSTSQISIFAYFSNPGGLLNFTFTGSGVIDIVVAEFNCYQITNVTTASDSGTGAASTVTTVTVTTGGTSLAGDLVIAGALEHISTATENWTPDPSGFTEFTGLLVTSASNHCYAAYDLAAASGGTQSVTVTSNRTALTNGWTGAVATFSEPLPMVMVPSLGQAEGIGQAIAAASQW